MHLENVKPIKFGGADEIIRQGACRYFGGTILNSHAANASTLRLYDGVDATGPLLAAVSLAAGEEALLPWLGPNGLICELGIYADYGGTGTLEGSVFVGIA